MKPILVFLERNNEGKYILTKEEIEEISQKAYDSGFEDGSHSTRIPTYTPVDVPDFTITCKDDDSIGRQESISID